MLSTASGLVDLVNQLSALKNGSKPSKLASNTLLCREATSSTSVDGASANSRSTASKILKIEFVGGKPVISGRIKVTYPTLKVQPPTQEGAQPRMIKDQALERAELINEIAKELVLGTDQPVLVQTLEMAERIINALETKAEWDERTQASQRQWTVPGVSGPRESGSAGTATTGQGTYTISNTRLPRNPSVATFGSFSTSGGNFPVPEGGSTEND